MISYYMIISSLKSPLQALRSDDTTLLDSVLNKGDIQTIETTVKRLPAPLVGQLLRKLQQNFLGKGQR